MGFDQAGNDGYRINCDGQGRFGSVDGMQFIVGMGTAMSEPGELGFCPS